MKPGILATAVVWTTTIVIAASVSSSGQGANSKTVDLGRADWSSLIGIDSISHKDVLIP